jgi:uncharacterized protein
MPASALQAPIEMARDRLLQCLTQARQAAADPALGSAIEPDITELRDRLSRLDQRQVTIAVFGLVSRGKSALVNALLGEQRQSTGPINGLTREPTRLSWNLDTTSGLTVDLIDTPGLDEIDGESRRTMAEEICLASDLILFVVAGDITRTEYRAIAQLWRSAKPLVVVFNKMDLYPPVDRRLIADRLAQVLGEPGEPSTLPPIVAVAAEPAPIWVRTTLANGRTEDNLETLPPQIQDLRQLLVQVLGREAPLLLALNSLIQTRRIETQLADRLLDLRRREAEAMIDRYAKTKGLAIGLNPIGGLDVLGGLISDLVLIRNLARLYGLPMTSYQAGQLLRQILLSSGGVLAAELANSLVWGLGKTASLADGPTAFNYLGAAATQGGIGVYGTYRIGEAAQRYLAEGCTWGEKGTSTRIAQLLAQVDRSSILAQLDRVQ